MLNQTLLESIYLQSGQFLLPSEEHVRYVGIGTCVTLLGAFVWTVLRMVVMPSMQAVVRGVQLSCTYLFTFIRVKLWKKTLVLKQPVTLVGTLQMNNETGEFYYIAKLGERDIRLTPNILSPHIKRVERLSAPLKEIALAGSELLPIKEDSNEITVKGLVALRNEEALIGMGCRIKYGGASALLTANHVWEALPVVFHVQAGKATIPVKKVDCEILVRAATGNDTTGGFDTICVTIPLGIWSGLSVPYLRTGIASRAEPFNLYGFNNIGQFCKVSGQRVLNPTAKAFMLRHGGTTLPGMSGSPLLNLRGEVIAIHTGRDTDGASNIAIGLWFTEFDNTLETTPNHYKLYHFDARADKDDNWREDVYVRGKPYDFYTSERYFYYKPKGVKGPKSEYIPSLDPLNAWYLDTGDELDEVPVFEVKKPQETKLPEVPVTEGKPFKELQETTFENKIVEPPSVIPPMPLPSFHLKKVSAASVKKNTTVGAEKRSVSIQTSKPLKTQESSKSSVEHASPSGQALVKKSSKSVSTSTRKKTPKVILHSGIGRTSPQPPKGNPSVPMVASPQNVAEKRPPSGTLGQETTVLIPTLSRKELKFYNKLIRMRKYHSFYKAATPEVQNKLRALAMHCATSSVTVLRNDQNPDTLTESLEWIMKCISENTPMKLSL